MRPHHRGRAPNRRVSMESGLEGRNNRADPSFCRVPLPSVSMESGLEGRNNISTTLAPFLCNIRLNGVRPRRPEQLAATRMMERLRVCLNGVRPRRPEQCDGKRKTRFGKSGLNGVRPRRPEQYAVIIDRPDGSVIVSMESGLEGRNNLRAARSSESPSEWSQWSPA